LSKSTRFIVYAEKSLLDCALAGKIIFHGSGKSFPGVSDAIGKEAGRSVPGGFHGVEKTGRTVPVGSLRG
jgi:hypothetical protein